MTVNAGHAGVINVWGWFYLANFQRAHLFHQRQTGPGKIINVVGRPAFHHNCGANDQPKGNGADLLEIESSPITLARRQQDNYGFNKPKDDT